MNKARYKRVKEGLILHCPFCNEQMLVENKDIRFHAHTTSIIGEDPLNPYIDHCGHYFYVICDQVLEVDRNGGRS